MDSAPRSSAPSSVNARVMSSSMVPTTSDPISFDVATASSTIRSTSATTGESKDFSSVSMRFAESTDQAPSPSLVSVTWPTVSP